MTVLETLLTTLCGMIATGGISHLFYLRRERKAVVKTAEVNTAEKAVDVMDRAFNTTIVRLEKNITQLEEDITKKKTEFKDEIKTLKGINEKVTLRLATLEAAIIEVTKCVHRDQCPVVNKLQQGCAGDIKQCLRSCGGTGNATEGHNHKGGKG